MSCTPPPHTLFVAGTRRARTPLEAPGRNRQWPSAHGAPRRIAGALVVSFQTAKRVSPSGPDVAAMLRLNRSFPVEVLTRPASPIAPWAENSLAMTFVPAAG